MLLPIRKLRPHLGDVFPKQSPSAARWSPPSDTRALLQKPVSVQNGELVLGMGNFDPSTSVFGGYMNHGSVGLIQFNNTQSILAFTVMYAERCGGEP
jgi:hypothetical protein